MSKIKKVNPVNKTNEVFLKKKPFVLTKDDSHIKKQVNNEENFKEVFKDAWDRKTRK